MSRRPLRLPFALLSALCLALVACAGTPAGDTAAAPRPAAAPAGAAGAAGAQEAALVRPFEDDGRTQRERDLETLGRVAGG